MTIDSYYIRYVYAVDEREIRFYNNRKRTEKKILFFWLFKRKISKKVIKKVLNEPFPHLFTAQIDKIWAFEVFSKKIKHRDVFHYQLSLFEYHKTSLFDILIIFSKVKSDNIYH